MTTVEGGTPSAAGGTATPPPDEVRVGRSYLSIGEVLDALKERFPDVTISKIRFFEAQGLLVPERTPSGYRKFYPADLERLGTILAEQQERYVPLAAARSTVQAVDVAETVRAPVVDRPGPPDEFFTPDDEGDDSDAPDHEASSMYDGVELGADRHPSQRMTGPRASTSSPSGVRSDALRAEAMHPTARRSTVSPLRRVPSPPPLDDRPHEFVGAESSGHSRLVHPPADEPPVTDEVDFDIVYSIEELIAVTGATSELVDDAMHQQFLLGRSVFGEMEFDEGDRRVLTSLVTFASHGIDPRHVRVFLHAAQREADLYVQATLPLLRRRPRAGVSVEDPFRRFGELEQAGAMLRTVVVRRALQQATEGVPGPVGR